MRVVNRTETVAVARAGGRSIEAVVRTTGIDARAGGRGFVYERRDPQALVLRGEDDVKRLEMPPRRQNLARFAVPVVAYALVRSMLRRRRKQ